jgi:DNA polymerase III epsilon subunit family exonuclease
MDQPLVVLDTETATLHGAPHLIELGAVKVVGGEALEHFRRFVRPEVPIEPEATAIHRIQDEDVRGAQPAGAVLEEFAAFAAGAWLAAHNARFDAQVLGFEFARLGREAPAEPLLDTLALARKHVPEAPDHKLPTLIAHLGIDAAESHRALPDAVAAWQVLERCVERMGGWSAVGTARLLAECGTPLSIRAAMPQAPTRPRAHVRALAAARRSGARVRLLYGSPGEAPAHLDVAPRLLYRMQERAYLEGECLRSGTLKTYRLDRVQRVLELEGDGSSGPSFASARAPGLE